MSRRGSAALAAAFAEGMRTTMDAAQGITPEQRRQMDYLSRGIYIDPDIHDQIQLSLLPWWKRLHHRWVNR